MYKYLFCLLLLAGCSGPPAPSTTLSVEEQKSLLEAAKFKPGQIVFDKITMYRVLILEVKVGGDSIYYYGKYRSSPGSPVWTHWYMEAELGGAAEVDKQIDF